MGELMRRYWHVVSPGRRDARAVDQTDPPARRRPGPGQGSRGPLRSAGRGEKPDAVSGGRAGRASYSPTSVRRRHRCCRASTPTSTIGRSASSSKPLVRCNWLQIMENSMDPVHLEWLHGKLYEFVQEQRGETTAFAVHRIRTSRSRNSSEACTSAGCSKRQLASTRPTGPSVTRSSSRPRSPSVKPADSGASTRCRSALPLDDTHTMHYWYGAFVPPAASVEIPAHMLDIAARPSTSRSSTSTAKYRLEKIDAQDVMAMRKHPGQITEGPHAGTISAWTDRGVVLVSARCCCVELAKVEAGHDPIGVVARSEQEHDRRVSTRTRPAPVRGWLRGVHPPHELEPLRARRGVDRRHHPRQARARGRPSGYRRPPALAMRRSSRSRSRALRVCAPPRWNSARALLEAPELRPAESPRTLSSRW